MHDTHYSHTLSHFLGYIIIVVPISNKKSNVRVTREHVPSPITTNQIKGISYELGRARVPRPQRIFTRTLLARARSQLARPVRALFLNERAVNKLY